MKMSMYDKAKEGDLLSAIRSRVVLNCIRDAKQQVGIKNEILLVGGDYGARICDGEARMIQKLVIALGKDEEQLFRSSRHAG